MNKQIFVFLILTAVVLQSCSFFGDIIKPEGNKVVDTYSVSDFRKISISGKMSLELMNGEQELRIETFENVHEYIETSVRNGELKVETKRNTKFSKDPQITLFVTADLINQIRISGSSNVYFVDYNTNDIAVRTSGSGNLYGSLTATSIAFKSSGSSRVDLQIDCNRLTNETSGSSKYKFAGLTETHEIVCSGTSTLEAFDLEAKHTNMQISGSAKIDVTVLETLNVNTSGSAHIRYKGNPQVSQKISGSGKIENI